MIVRDRDRLPEAEEIHRTVLRLRETGAARFPSVRLFTEHVIQDELIWADIAWKAGRPRAAEEALADAATFLDRQTAKIPSLPRPEQFELVASSYLRVADALMEHGAFAAAEPVYRNRYALLCRTRGRTDTQTCDGLDHLARLLLSQGRIGEVISDLDQDLQARPDEPVAHSRAALARLAAGNRDGYRRTCAAALARFAGWHAPGSLEVVRGCLLVPGTVDDLASSVDLARAAVAASPKTPWFLYALGLGLYRAGQHDEAIRRLTESLQCDPPWGAAAVNWPLLAMAHWRLGHAAEARRWLAMCRPAAGDAAQSTRPGELMDPSAPWWDRAEFQVLRHEAEALILDSCFPVDPFSR